MLFCVCVKVNVSGNTRTVSIHKIFNSTELWQEFEEEIPSFIDTSIRSGVLLDQMNMTKDVSDYLWYTLRCVLLEIYFEITITME